MASSKNAGRHLQAVDGEFVPYVKALEIVLPGAGVRRSGVGEGPGHFPLVAGKPDSENVGNRFCDLPLDGSGVRRIAVVAAGPQVIVIRCAVELDGDAQAVSGSGAHCRQVPC